MIRLDQVGKVVGGQVHIHPTSLDLEAGRLNVLLGPTGAGKTTLLRMLAGLDRPTSGRIFDGDRDVTAMDVRRRNVAFVYQQFVNYPSLTVYENIASPLRVAGVNSPEMDARVHETATLLGIDDLLDRRPEQLSGGQQQRCAIARALIKDARLILLDEPLANLDFKLREQLRERLRALLTERDAVVVYATAEPEEALILDGHTSVVDAGRILQTDIAHEAYRHPTSARVGELFSDPPMNLLDAVWKGGRFHVGNVTWEAERPPTECCTLGIRAHHLELTPGEKTVEVPVVVDLAELSGSATRLHSHLGERTLIAQADGVHSIELGTQCSLYFDPAHVLVFDERGNAA